MLGGFEEACCGCVAGEGEDHSCGHECCGSESPATPEQPTEDLRFAHGSPDALPDPKKGPVYEAQSRADGSKTHRVTGGTLRRLARLQRWTI